MSFAQNSAVFGTAARNRLAAGVGALSVLLLMCGVGGFFFESNEVFAASRERPSESTESTDSGDDGNPAPPYTTDPEMRRVHSVPLPGRNADADSFSSSGRTKSRAPSDSPSRARAGGGRNVTERESAGAIATVEAGYGVVRKPEMREATVTHSPARILLLNGVDISAVRGETLENVTVTIDAAGNVEMVAPHYEVGADTSFHPLLPTELPRLPKERRAPLGMPEGRYRKEGDQAKRKQPLEASEAPLGMPGVQEPRVEVLEEQGRPLRVRSEPEDIPAEGTPGARGLPAR
jgi:hypothetical protein